MRLVGLTSRTSSSTSGGSIERYKTLAELYDECEQLSFIQDAEEPISYSMPAKNGEWMEAMKIDLDVIERNRNGYLVDLSPGRNPIRLKWVYKLKRDPKGNVLKYKVRLFTNGYV